MGRGLGGRMDGRGCVGGPARTQVFFSLEAKLMESPARPDLSPDPAAQDEAACPEGGLAQKKASGAQVRPRPLWLTEMSGRTHARGRCPVTNRHNLSLWGRHSGL